MLSFVSKGKCMNIKILTRSWSIILVLVPVVLLFCQPVSAHAVLLSAQPEPNSQLAKSPSSIILTFNERLEKELYYIRVYNQKAENVVQSPTEMSLNQHVIQVKLPPLKDGVYTVTYHIISADGHPVENSYIISVGNQAVNRTALYEKLLHYNQRGPQLTLWFERVLYYMSLLFLTGWVFWGSFRTFEPKEYRFWLRYLKHFYALMLGVIGFVQISNSISDNGWAGLPTLLFHTLFGETWMFSVIMLLIGYMLVPRWTWFTMLWIVSLLTAEGINGHAITIPPKWYSVTLDSIHLISASIWIGGVLLILSFWKKDKQNVRSFLPVFSRTAFFSILLLFVTGTLLTLQFITRLSDLIHSVWGILLLIKIGFVLLVIISAAFIRRARKRNREQSLRLWLRNDLIWMLCIIIIVGLLTYVRPFPSNEPFFWKTSRNQIAFSVEINPNNPLVSNNFNIQVLTGNSKEKPKAVKMKLIHLSKPQIAPIELPLHYHPETKIPAGSREVGGYDYEAKGPYITIPGRWELEVRILDQNDNETVFHKDFTVYTVSTHS